MYEVLDILNPEFRTCVQGGADIELVLQVLEIKFPGALLVAKWVDLDRDEVREVKCGRRLDTLIGK